MVATGQLRTCLKCAEAYGEFGHCRCTAPETYLWTCPMCSGRGNVWAPTRQRCEACRGGYLSKEQAARILAAMIEAGATKITSIEQHEWIQTMNKRRMQGLEQRSAQTRRLQAYFRQENGHG